MAKGADTDIDFYIGQPLTGSSSPLFQTAAQQRTYWNARLAYHTTGNLYLRHTRGSVKIRTNAFQNDYNKITEISWTNKNYDNMTYYARVVDFEVINNGAVEFFFEVDDFQTWCFDAQYWSSHIDREGLTEAEYALAEANPWRNDIIELLTPEPDLPVSRELEESYRLPKTNVSEDGQINGFADGAPQPPVNGGGVPGLITMWPEVGTTPGTAATGNDSTIVIALSSFRMNGDPYGSTDGAFDFTELTGPAYGAPGNENGAKCNVSWITPSTASVIDPATAARPFYLIGIRVNGTVCKGFNVLRENEPVGYGGPDRLNRVMGLLAKYNLSHMVVAGPSVLHSDFVITDIALQGRTVTSASGPSKVGAKVLMAPNGAHNVRGQHKLSRSPFRYVRAIAPDGSETALVRERFVDPRNPSFVAYADFDGDPTVSLMPFKYDGNDVDYQKRLSFGSFPTMAYSTDAYLTQLGQMREESLMSSLRPSDNLRVSGNNDVQYMGDKMAITQAGADVNAKIPGLSAITSMDPNQLMSSMNSGPEWGNDYAGRKATADLMKSYEDTQIHKYSTTGDYGDLPNGMLDSLRGAMVGTNFHAGNMGNSTMYKLSRQGFKIVDVRLRDEVTALYADYFKMYGYASGRLGVPKVIQATRGGAIPHFDSLDGQLVTYVKTSNIKISGIPAGARRNIEAMFNGGHRFIKGW